MSERNIGAEIIQGLENAIEYAKGDKSKGREMTVLVPKDDVNSSGEEPTAGTIRSGD